MSVDIKSFSINGKPPERQATGNNHRWWLLDGKEAAQSIHSVVEVIANSQQARHTQMNQSARLYGNLSLYGNLARGLNKAPTALTAHKSRISYNVIQSAIDTITSKMCKNKPSPLFLTSKGDYRLQKKAESLNDFTLGLFYANDAYELGPKIFKDACVFGTGVVHVYNDHGKVKFERVLLSELIIDEVEGFYDSPRQLHRVKNVDRELLIDLFPEHEALLRQASETTVISSSTPNIADQIRVIESWHLKSGPEADDGKHVISINGETLLEEAYEADCFPFAMLHWSKSLYGPFAQSLAEQLQNIQLEMNKILWVIQRSLELGGSFKILVENSSKIVKEYLNDTLGTVVNYSGTPPQYITPPMVQPELYQQLVTLKNQAYETAGISQLSAASLKPAGLNSGKALREFSDIESDRFQVVGQNYERFFLDLARLGIMVAKQIYETDKSFAVTVPGKKFLKTIKWADINLDDDQYQMQCFPISSLPNDPSGRLQTVQEYVQAGFLSPTQAKKLLQFPDLDAVMSLENAQLDYLHEILDRVVEEGQYTVPEPYDNLQLASELALQYYSLGKQNGLEEEKLELLRRFIDQVNDLGVQAKQQTPAQPAPANPEATPTSDLVPNVNQAAA